MSEWLDRIGHLERDRDRKRRARSIKRERARHDPRVLDRPVRHVRQDTFPKMAGLDPIQISNMSRAVETQVQDQQQDAIQDQRQDAVPDWIPQRRPPPQVRPSPHLYEVLCKGLFVVWHVHSRAKEPVRPLIVSWSPKATADSIVDCALRLGLDALLTDPAHRHTVLCQRYLGLAQARAKRLLPSFPLCDLDDLLVSMATHGPTSAAIETIDVTLSRFTSFQAERQRGAITVFTKSP